MNICSDRKGRMARFGELPSIYSGTNRASVVDVSDADAGFRFRCGLRHVNGDAPRRRAARAPEAPRHGYSRGFKHRARPTAAVQHSDRG